jgi:hypothetical protein
MIREATTVRKPHTGTRRIRAGGRSSGNSQSTYNQEETGHAPVMRHTFKIDAMSSAEILIIVLVMMLAAVFYLIYRVYIKPRKSHRKLPGGIRKKLGL